MLVVSVLALLALACFPVLAHADSSEVQYQDSPPTVTGGKVPTDRQPPSGGSKVHHGGGATALASNANGSRSSGKGSAANGSSSESSGAGTAGAAQQGSPGKASGQGSGSPGKTARNAEPTSSKSDGGSSPMVPILIAILVLAAISLGVVIVRRRRHGTPAARVSPKAG
jgi:cobalamin biosynthesis Mg chelatase CobN